MHQDFKTVVLSKPQVNPITHRIHIDPSEAAQRRLENGQNISNGLLNLVSKIKAYRISHGYTQQEVANRLCIRTELVRDLESQKVKSLDPQVVSKIRGKLDRLK
jgi:DNA-binding XRE family transcriptional regulator